ncbi:hypothetical protein BT67DRAFT_22561 [Trichocladium antarcticum]|uniref:Secreted protein n=1 Tax=Trichocladium antarcticum TaxID=1450529 RepID=A0AAN6ZGZ5_9PEZI|nr:hypothetical protein BT67DRAFT_22561 [Trichocladium antarcticum]
MAASLVCVGAWRCWPTLVVGELLACIPNRAMDQESSPAELPRADHDRWNRGSSARQCQPETRCQYQGLEQSILGEVADHPSALDMSNLDGPSQSRAQWWSPRENEPPGIKPHGETGVPSAVASLCRSRRPNLIPHVHSSRGYFCTALTSDPSIR